MTRYADCADIPEHMFISARRVALAIGLFLSLVAAVPARAQSSVAELNDEGWKAVQKGDGDRASMLFARALDLRPRDAVLLLGFGTAAHLQGRPAEAISRLQQSLVADPKLTSASRLLGHLAYDQGQVDLAIQTDEKALAFAPRDPELTTQLEAWRSDAKAHENFEEVRYDRFKVLFEGHDDQLLAVQVSSILTRSFWKITEKLGEYPSDSIVAILYTEKQFRDNTRAPEWSVALYDGRIRIPTAGATKDPDLFESVLTHELTHAVVSHIARRGVPVWMHEGLAQYFEGEDRQAALRRLKASGRYMPLSRLEGSFTSLNATDAKMAYDESLLAVSVIMERAGFGWGRLLHSLADGESVERVLESFGFSYADLEAPFAR